MSTRVYKFGLRGPTQNADLVRVEITGGHRYANRLVEVERARRAALREYEAQAGDLPALSAAYRAADDAYQAADRVVRVHRSRTRKKDETQAMKDEVRQTREARRQAKSVLCEARAKLRRLDAPSATYLAMQQAVKTHGKRSPQKYNAELALMADPLGGREGIEARVNFVLRGFRKERECAWGTGGLVEASRDQKQKMPLYQFGTEPNDPRFRAATAEWRITEDGTFTRAGLDAVGRLGVQLTAGKQAVTGILDGTNTFVRVSRQDSDPKRGRRMGQRFVLSMRVGTDDGAPVWACWPMVMHRPLPADGHVKGVTVSVSTVADREDWCACFTVTTGDGVSTCGRGSVAIDLGWRQLASGDVRVASWWGDDGEHGEVRCPARIISRLGHADEIRSVRGGAFNRARAALGVRLASLTLPTWMVESTRTLASWHSPARLSALATHWTDHRFDGDEDAYVDLEGWRKQNLHLWQWEANERRTAEAARTEVYRLAGASLAARYHTVVWEDFDLAKMKSTHSTNETAKRNFQCSAPGDARRIVIQAFTGRGGADVKVSAVDSTHICHFCGSVEEYDAIAMLVCKCDACGTEWDQDENAAKVLLTRYNIACERANGHEPPGVARNDDNPNNPNGIRETKWQRKEWLAQEKQLRLAAARNTYSDGAE